MARSHPVVTSDHMPGLKKGPTLSFGLTTLFDKESWMSSLTAAKGPPDENHSRSGAT